MLYNIKLNKKNTSESSCKGSTQRLAVSLHGQYVLIGCWNGFEVCPKERPLSRAGKRQIQWILEFHKWGYLKPNDFFLQLLSWWKRSVKPGKRVNCTSEAFPVQHEREMSQLTWSEAWLGKELSLKVSHYMIYIYI